MSTMLLTLGLLLTATGDATPRESVIDTFRYADDASVQDAWRAAENTPPVAPSPVDSRVPRALVLKAPFHSAPNLNRAIIDRAVSDKHTRRVIADADAFRLSVYVDEPTAFSYVTLYFHMGDGWRSTSKSLSKGGWNELTFERGAYRSEGSPGAWEDVDKIRLSFWAGDRKDTTVSFRTLDAVRRPVVILTPDANADEASAARECAERVTSMLEAAGVACGSIDGERLTRLSPDAHPLVVAAYIPRWDDALTKSLIDYIERGGRVVAFYTLPAQAYEALGFKGQEYVRADGAATFAEVVFNEGTVPGAPGRMRQSSWNITSLEPATPDARVAAVWHDANDRPTPYPALLTSERGAFFTHILLSDDAANKQRFLAAICARYVPSLWDDMVASARDRALLVGSSLVHEDALQFVREADASAAANVERLMKEAAAADEPVRAVDLYREARDALAETYVAAVPSREPEMRAWWNHSGTGAYSGDWDRTMRELSDAGFNMVLPNMLWGGLAHYESDVLPRSRTYEEHGDQIAQCVAAGKRHGVEVHVWKVNWNLSTAPRSFIDSMRREGRTQVDSSGEPTDWLCPSHPENQQLELESMLEVARKYDVDGLHFDYIRYPNNQSCFCDGCRKRFEEQLGRAVEHWPEDCCSGKLKDAYNDWRCDNITQLVEAVHREAKRIRPDIDISAAVFGSYPSCREWVSQDWPVWIDRGYLDFVCPMDYTNSDTAFDGLVTNQRRLIDGRIPLLPGIGLTASHVRLSPDRVAGQIEIARERGCEGFTLFNLSESTAREMLPALSTGPTRPKPAP